MIFSIWLNSPHPVNCLEVSGSHQRSGTQASGSIHAEQVLHANTLQTCIRGSHCPLFFLSVRGTHLSKQSAGSSPLLILHLPLPLPIFSSLPSSSFKGIEHRYIRTFSHLFSYTFNSIIQYYVTPSLNF